MNMLGTAPRLQLLQNIYQLFDRFCAPFDTACQKGCAQCCTANVTLTTLEGLLILDHLTANSLEPALRALEQTAARARFQPTLTINDLAELCARDQDPPDEGADPGAGACPLRAGDLCTIYAVRPLGCRAMQSRTHCAQTGAADMPELILTAANLFPQFIEAIDITGLTGNLSDILLYLSVPAQRAHYESGQKAASDHLPANRAIPVLMIPPEHRPQMQPLIEDIKRMVQASGR